MQSNQNIEEVPETEETPEDGNNVSHPIIHEGKVRGTRFGSPIEEAGVSDNHTFF